MKWVYAATVLAALAIVAGLPVARPETLRRARRRRATEIDTTAPRANPVLSRARAALAAGRFEAPAGRNALDLFKAVLLDQPNHVEAQAGFEQAVRQVLRRARGELAAGRHDEAGRLVQRVLSADPRRPDALTLQREIDPPETPSSQLAREQEIAAQFAANVALGVSADVAAPVATQVPVVTADPGSAKPTPVATQVPLVTADPGAKPTPVAVAPLGSPPRTGLATTPAIAAAATPIVAKAVVVPASPPLRVMPDPLAPRFTNSPPVVSNAIKSGKRIPRAYGGPVPPRHDIAGLATPSSRTERADPAPVRTSQVSAQPVPVDEFNRIESREPVYPRQALRDKTRGWVELEFTITESGAVRDVVVLDAEPLGVFDRAATDAVASWRFRPRYVNGKPVLQRSSFTIRFDRRRLTCILPRLNATIAHSAAIAAPPRQCPSGRGQTSISAARATTPTSRRRRGK